MAKKIFKLLSPGNSGNKAANRDLALEFFVRWIEGAEKVDSKTINTSKYGLCHVSAYTDSTGAMISSGPGKRDQKFDPRNHIPHSRDHWLMFREVGDGRVFVFVCDPKDLFELRSIGASGVTWADVMSCSIEKKAFEVGYVKDVVAGETSNNP